MGRADLRVSRMKHLQPLCEIVGFNYSAATLELLRVMTYDDLKDKLGYQSKGSISQLIDGVIPAHDKGEALWAVYVDTFRRKPPISVRQSGQLTTT